MEDCLCPNKSPPLTFPDNYNDYRDCSATIKAIDSVSNRYQYVLPADAFTLYTGVTPHFVLAPVRRLPPALPPTNGARPAPRS